MKSIKILVDTNIVLDYIIDRKWSNQAVLLFEDLIPNKKVIAYITASSVTDIYYLVSKKIGKEQAQKIIETVILNRNIFEIIDTSRSDIEQAVKLKKIGIKDFEDGVQISTARREKLQYIVTRNTKDFEKSPIKTLTPSEFYKKFTE